MNFEKLRVLVLDGYGRQVPSILQQLHDLGCISTTLNCSKLDVGYTSHYPAKKIVEPQTRYDKDALKAVLDREILSGQYDAVLPMLEPATEVLTKNIDVYKKYVKVVAAPYNSFMKAYDKQVTMRICMENGIPCPITKLDTESLGEYLSKVSFPLACKPRKGTGSIGFYKVDNIEELNKLVDSGSLVVEDYVIQEYIPQTDMQYGAYLMIGLNQQMKSALVVEKTRWYPIGGGAGCLIRTVNSDEMIDYSEWLLKALKWRGFGHLGFIMDPRDKVPKLMEINGRIPASIKICKYAGIPIVEQLLLTSFDEDCPKHEHPIQEDLRLRYFQTDVMWFLQSPNRWKVKPSWFNNRRTKDYIFSWRDPIPFFSYTISHIKTMRADMEKRKR